MRNKMKSPAIGGQATFGGKKILKIIGTVLLALVLTITLTGCRDQQAAKPSSLIIWGFVDEDVFKPIIKDFKSSNSSAKNMDIKYVKKDLNSNYENDALNSILSGQGPDVWAIPNDWVYRHKEKLAAMPANMLTDKKIIAKDYFADVVIADNIFNNQIYGLTPTIDILQAYYNPLLFENAQSYINKTFGENNQSEQSSLVQILSKFPITWEEFNKIIPYLTVKNGALISVAGAAIGTTNNVSKSADLLSLLMLQNSTKMLSDDLSQATFNLPIKNSAGVDVYAGKNSLDFYSGFANPGAANYAWNSGMPSDIEAFVQGKVAIIFGYSDLAIYFKQVYPNFQFQQALMPQIGEVNNIIDYARYATYVVPEASPNITTAWQFIDFLSTDEASTYLSATKEVPSRKIPTEADLKNRGAGTPSQDQIKTAQSWNKGRYPVEVDNIFKQAIDRINNRSQNSQASFDTAAAKVTELLRKTTW